MRRLAPLPRRGGTASPAESSRSLLVEGWWRQPNGLSPARRAGGRRQRLRSLFYSVHCERSLRQARRLGSAAAVRWQRSGNLVGPAKFPGLEPDIWAWGFHGVLREWRSPHKAASPGYCAENHIPNQLQNWSTSVMSPRFGKGRREDKSNALNGSCETH